MIVWIVMDNIEFWQPEIFLVFLNESKLMTSTTMHKSKNSLDQSNESNQSKNIFHRSLHLGIHDIRSTFDQNNKNELITIIIIIHLISDEESFFHFLPIDGSGEKKSYYLHRK